MNTNHIKEQIEPGMVTVVHLFAHHFDFFDNWKERRGEGRKKERKKKEKGKRKERGEERGREPWMSEDKTCCKRTNKTSNTRDP